MGLSFWQIAIVVILVVLLFGRGKISALMTDLAGGIKSFKKGMSDEEQIETKDDTTIDVTAESSTEKDPASKS